MSGAVESDCPVRIAEDRDGENMKDEVTEFIAWLENPGDTAPAAEPVVNADPLQARIPVARPELTWVDVDRWMNEYDPEWDWQEDAATDAQLGYLRSLLRRQGLFLSDDDTAYMTKGQASHMIDLLSEEPS